MGQKNIKRKIRGDILKFKALLYLIINFMFMQKFLNFYSYIYYLSITKKHS